MDFFYSKLTLSKLQSYYSIIPTDPRSKKAVIDWKEATQCRLLLDIHPFDDGFTFRGAACSIAMIAGKVSGGVEVLDIDLKNDCTKGTAFITAVRESYPDVYSRFTVQVTMNGGYHFLYKCSVVDGNRHLATSTLNNGAKVFIETRGEGGYALLAPSKGYKVIQGDLLNIQEITPEERGLIHELARQFSDKKVKAQSVCSNSKKLSKKDSSPILKVPVSFSPNADQAKLYSRFLDYKRISVDGRIPLKYFKEGRTRNAYWLDKLVAANWAYKKHGAYFLFSYKKVWADLSIRESAVDAKKNRSYVPFISITDDDLSTNQKERLKQIEHILLKQTASNQRKQMLHAKTAATHDQVGENPTEFLGCRASAKLFGRKSVVTGRKYRSIFFEVVPSERKLRRATKEEYAAWRNKEKHVAEYLYPCDRVKL